MLPDPHADLLAYLDAADQIGLECDGLVRVLAADLGRRGIPHTPMMGGLKPADSPGQPLMHFWIDFPDGTRLDLRARMWFGPTMPHGVFQPEHHQNAAYQGEPVTLTPLPAPLLALMMEDRCHRTWEPPTVPADWTLPGGRP